MEKDTEILRLYGVNIPKAFQGNLERAKEYVAGFFVGKNTEVVFPAEIKALIDKYGSPITTQNVNNQERIAYICGYMKAGQTIGGNFQLPKGGYSREIREPTPDLTVLMRRAKCHMNTLADALNTMGIEEDRI